VKTNDKANNDSVQHEHMSFWDRIAESIATNPWRLIFLWLLIFVASIPLAVALQDHLTPTRTIAGTESAYVDQLIAERFGKDSRHAAVLVIAGLRPVHEDADRDILKSIIKAIRAWPQVLRANSIIDFPRGLMVGADGTGAIVTVQFRPGTDADELEISLGRLASEIAQQSAGRDNDLRLYWTGNFFLHADVAKASEQGARQAEITALPLTLLLLLAIFGSIRAALCPVVSAVVAVVVSIGCTGLIATLVPWSPSVLMQNVISLIGLALTIDYSLLTVNQFRRATEQGLSSHDAIIAAIAKSAPTIALAGFSVLLGFSALMVVPVEEIRAIGIGGALASVLAIMVSTTLLPAILGLLAPRLARSGRAAGGAKARRFFAAITRSVCRRPIIFLLISTVPLILLALPIQGLRITAHNENWLPPEAQSTRGVEALVEMGRWGLANEILVVAEAPVDDMFFSAPGWAMAHDIYGRLAVLDDIASVIALPRSMSAKLKPETLQNIPRRTLDPLLSCDNRTMLFRVIPDSDLDYRGLERLVRRIRRLNYGDQTDGRASAIVVGGMPASTVDYVGIVWTWMPYVVGLVIMGAFLVLAISFRSPVVALKAVVLNLFSVSAAFGLATLVFLDGYGASLIGVQGPVDGVFPAMPLVVFCAVFGVSMDYEVFLLSRIASARRVEPGETAAIVRGVSETGMVITIAAAIMILVFGSFATPDFLPAKMLGFTLATAVFLDATIVRILMSPTLMHLAGRWNWWPGM
jgi:RND superfamily putative drug exporter